MKKPKHPFRIDHIDPLGQGVSKSEDNIFFIHNTLEGEEGHAKIDAEKKGLLFGHLESTDDLTKTSEKRIHAKCPHFFECNGCHYLHTSYDHELDIKRKNLLRLMNLYKKKQDSKIQIQEIKIHKSSNRNHTRNRIQLHYDLHKRQIGLIGHQRNQIIEVPHCIIARKEVQEQIQLLYDNNQWMKLIPPNAPKKGHIEIIFKNDAIDIVPNHPYSHGGFTQVNDEMNKSLRNIIFDISNREFSRSDVIFDLFGGSGNLSKKLKSFRCLVVDSYGDGMLVDRDGHQEFVKKNLYSKTAPLYIRELINKYQAKSIIIDPPRSGLKNIDEFLDDVSTVEELIYVSCNPSTLFRDLSKIPSFELHEIHLVDLFPGTFHYETVCFLRKSK